MAAPTFLGSLAGSVKLNGEDIHVLGITRQRLDLYGFAPVRVNDEVIPGRPGATVRGDQWEARQIVLVGEIHGDTRTDLINRLDTIKAYLSSFQGRPWVGKSPVKLELTKSPYTDRYWEVYYNGNFQIEPAYADELATIFRIQIGFRAAHPYAIATALTTVTLTNPAVGTWEQVALGTAPSSFIMVWRSNATANPSLVISDLVFYADFNDDLDALDMEGGALAETYSGYTLSTPGVPTVTPQGASGSTTWGYRISARWNPWGSVSGETLAGTEGQTTTGNATLNGTNFNRITWTAVSYAADYRIYRVTAGGTPSSTGLIGTATSTTFDDTGLAGSGAVPSAGTSVASEYKMYSPHRYTKRFLMAGASTLAWTATGNKAACSVLAVLTPNFNSNADATNRTFFKYAFDTNNYLKLWFDGQAGAEGKWTWRKSHGAGTLNDVIYTAASADSTNFTAGNNTFVVCATFGPAGLKLYIDGTQRGTTNVNTTALDGNPTSVTLHDTGDTTYAETYLDEVYVWARELSADEVKRFSANPLLVKHTGVRMDYTAAGGDAALADKETITFDSDKQTVEFLNASNAKANRLSRMGTKWPLLHPPATSIYVPEAAFDEIKVLYRKRWL